MKRCVLSLIALAGLGLTGGCMSHNNVMSDAPSITTARILPAAGAQPQDHKEGKHRTAHDGVLNAIVKCEIGHAEVKREGDTLHIWFVGGAPDTTKAVPIPDRTISLKFVTSTAGLAKVLILKPEPLDLAGETIGNCSRFSGTAPWLPGMARFTASAQITFKGQKQPLRIEYPDGYDPD